MSIHDNIRHIREIHNLTQEQMAEKLNMSPSGYAKIERGVTNLKFDKLEQIANIFNIDINELMKLGANNEFILLINENGNNANYGSNIDKNTAFEIEKLNLSLAHSNEIIQQKNEIIEQKNQEIQALKEIIKLMKKSDSKNQ